MGPAWHSAGSPNSTVPGLILRSRTQHLRMGHRLSRRADPLRCRHRRAGRTSMRPGAPSSHERGLRHRLPSPVIATQSCQMVAFGSRQNLPACGLRQLEAGLSPDSVLSFAWDAKKSNRVGFRDLRMAAEHRSAPKDNSSRSVESWPDTRDTPVTSIIAGSCSPLMCSPNFHRGPASILAHYLR